MTTRIKPILKQDLYQQKVSLWKEDTPQGHLRLRKDREGKKTVSETELHDKHIAKGVRSNRKFTYSNRFPNPRQRSKMRKWWAENANGGVHEDSHTL